MQALADEWKQRLGLAHWTFYVRFARERELQPDHFAELWPCDEKLNATIVVLDERDLKPHELVGPQDIEETIVHELLHVHFILYVKHKNRRIKDILFEQTINALARALITLKREREDSKVSSILNLSTLAMIVGKAIVGGNWKQDAAKMGTDAANQFLRQKAWDELNASNAPARIVAHMKEQDFQWDGKGKEFLAMNDEGLGEGFKISRRIIYDGLKALHVPGGTVRDDIRDALDNGVWANIKDQCPTGTALETVFTLTMNAVFDKELGTASRPA